MRSMLVRKLLAYGEISIDNRLPQITFRLLSVFEKDPPPGSIESLPDWDSPLEIQQDSKDKALQDIDHEMEALFERKFEEEDDVERGLFESPQGLPNKDAIHRALAVFEEEFKKSENSEKTVPIQFSSKFGTFKSSFMRELTDVGLDDPTDPAPEKHRPNGLIQDFVNGYRGGGKVDSMVESFFGPEGGQKRYQKVLFNDRKDLLQDVDFGSEAQDHSIPNSKGGFRISVYRNVTGSIKRLLQSVRNEVLPNFITKTTQFHKPENHEFLTLLIESLKYADHHEEDSTRSYILPQMNTLCLMLLERLPYLTADEIALVCLVFGKLGYVNSLVFHRLFAQLQKEEFLSTMSNEGLFGTVLSLGMLQSTEPEFLNLAKREFETRFVNSNQLEIPKDSIGCFLFGSCRSKDPEQATSLSESVLDFICQQEVLMNEDSVSWSDLGLALYVTHQLQIWKPALIRGVHQRLLKNRDLNCNEASVLLLGLEHQPPRKVKAEISEIWAQSFALLQDSIEEMISQNKIDVMSVPDIIKSFTFPGHIRVRCFEELGKKIVTSGELSAPLPLWSICYKLMAGYANVRYRDAEVLKALNKRFLETRMGAISPRTVVQLLHVGLMLRGLEEAVVDRLVELMSATPHFWRKIHRPKDAAKASYALAGFQKLTPEILKYCWESCKEVKFSEVDSMNIAEKLETVFIAQGLFSGYQYIASTYSAEIASHQIPDSGKNRIFNLIKKRNLYESGSETKVQGEVSSTLASMGISVACPVLILDGLYSVDMALHHKKVVVFLFKDRSHYANPPFAINGRAMMHVRELEAQGIKVVCIKDKDWLSLTPDQRPSFLESKFIEHGLSMQELKALNPKSSIPEAMTTEELKNKVDRFLRDRVAVLKELKLSRLKDLFQARQGLLKDSDDMFQKLTDNVLDKYKLLPPSKTNKKRTVTPVTKRAIIQRIVAFEAEKLFGSAMQDAKSKMDHDLTATG